MDDPSGGRRRKTPVRMLADETLPRIKMLVENSASNPDRPRLSEEAEQRLAEVEAKSAQTYAEVEETTHRIFKLADQIGVDNGGVVQGEIDDDLTKKEV